MFSFVYKSIDFAHKLDPCSPTEEYYKHIHYFYEILFFVRGNVQYTVESETKQLKEGDIVLIQPGKFHYATVDLSVPYERYVLKFPEHLIPENIREKVTGKNSFYSNTKKYEVVFNQFDAYQQKFSDDELYLMFLCETLKLIVMICHEPVQSEKKHGVFIDSIIDFIDANIKNPISMQTLTKEFHYSQSFINVEFKRHMKIPVMKYIRLKKIIAAHRMILSGTKKSVVAEMFGFDDYSTFYRTYKKFLKQSSLGNASNLLD